ncbi:MAG: PAS domain S-box protein [Bryobacteraceae bacterium]
MEDSLSHERPVDDPGAAAALGLDNGTYVRLVEDSLGLICIHDLDGKLLYVNPAAAQSLGYPRSLGKDRSLREFLAPAAQPLFDAYLHRIRNRPSDTGYMRLATQAGEERIWLYRNVRQGERVLGHALDVTELVHAKKTLEAAVATRTHDLELEKERYRELFENANDIVFIIDLEGNIESLNRAGEALLGVRPRDGRVNLRQFLSPESLQRSRDMLAAKLAGSGPTTYEVEVASPGRGPRLLDISTRLIHRDGRPVGVQGIARDITERRHGEARLSLAQRIARLGSWEHDLVTGQWTWSEEMGRIFGMPDPALEGLVDRVHPDDREAVRAMFTSEQGCRPCHIEHRVLLPGNSVRYVRQLTEVIANQAGEAILIAGTAQDVTDARLLEEQVRQSQKLEAIGRLAGGVAHDFNNLLTVIGGYAQMMLDTGGLGDANADNMRQILAASLRATSLTRQLLAFGRKQISRPKMLNLNSVVGGMEELLRRTIGAPIELRTVKAEGLKSIRIDPGHLEQVLMNLVINARDAMPRGGTITIATANARFQDENFVMLSVRDTGEGMAEETLSKIFEPFFTTKPVGKGTGLGLATVYGIVKQNEGQIDVTSAPGKGAEFRIYLPLAEHRGSRATA